MSIAGYKKSISIKTTGSTAGYLEIPGVSATLNLGAEMLDDTDFTSTGWKSRIAGLRDYSCSGDAIFDVTVAAVPLLRSAVLNGTRLLFKYLPDGSHGLIGTVLVENMNHSGDVGALEKFSFSLNSEGQPLTTV